MAEARVVHCKKEPYDVYIGRPGKWGNPYLVGEDGNRAQVIAKYRSWLTSRADLIADLHELDGKVLGCWCAPEPCHGDVLVELLRPHPHEPDCRVGHDPWMCARLVRGDGSNIGDHCLRGPHDLVHREVIS